MTAEMSLSHRSGAKDLVAATGAALEAGLTVAHVEQPYLVAGRRSPAPAKQLDTAWTAVMEHLRGGELDGLPLVAGGGPGGAPGGRPPPRHARAPPRPWPAVSLHP